MIQMSKTLFIGDLHVQINNLEDTGEIFNLADQILEKDSAISMVCLLGDIFHTHDVLRQEPAFFVREKIKNLIEKYESRVEWIALAGNHDYSTPTAVTTDNAVRLTLGDILTVVDNEVLTKGRFAFVPFTGDNEEFLKKAMSPTRSTILVCHQTFDGSRYENNQTAPHGVDQNKLTQKLIISGHIHTKQNLKNSYNEVVYVGTPRALNSNETNEKKYLTVFDSDTYEFELHSTDHLVKQFIAIHLKQGDNTEETLSKYTWKPKDDVRVHISGNQEFYDRTLEQNKHLQGKVRFVPDIRKELSNVLDIDSGEFTVDEALHKYVHEVVDMSDELREAVWMKLQKLMPQLGTNR